MVRYATWKDGIFLSSNSVSIQDGVFESIKFSLQEGYHNKCKKTFTAHQSMKASVSTYIIFHEFVLVFGFFSAVLEGKFPLPLYSVHIASH